MELQSKKNGQRKNRKDSNNTDNIILIIAVRKMGKGRIVKIVIILTI